MMIFLLCSFYDEGDVDVDDMQFTYGGSSVIAQDEIVLESTDDMEKLAIAYAFAQSARLSIYELRMERETVRIQNKSGARKRHPHNT
jgi:uncharacterized Rmd1/YagE family protein